MIRLMVRNAATKIVTNIVIDCQVTGIQPFIR